MFLNSRSSVSAPEVVEESTAAVLAWLAVPVAVLRGVVVDS
jgi:hypothetical protein